MKLLLPSFSIIEQENNYNLYKHIAHCYSTVYKQPIPSNVEDCRKLVDLCEDNKNYKILAHGAIYLVLPLMDHYVDKYKDGINCYCYESIGDSKLYVTTTYDQIIINNYYTDLAYLSRYTPLHEKFVTIKFVVDKISAARLCNAGEKFNITPSSLFSFANKKDISFIIPSWASVEEGSYTPIIVNGIKEYKNPLNEINYSWCKNDSTEKLTEEQENSIKQQNTSYSFLNRRSEIEEKIIDLSNNKDFKLVNYKNFLGRFGVYELVMTATLSDWKKFTNTKILTIGGTTLNQFFLLIQSQL